MDYNYLADLLYPGITATPEEMEARFPKRELPEGAKVTRFAPSPTGFVHFGGLFPTRVSERLAHQSGGVLFLRIEDTDAKREVEGAEENLIETLAYYGVKFDEGAIGGGRDNGAYGPYRQSERAEIYQCFAKKLIRDGVAYPCFCTEDELNAIRAEQEQIKADPGYYGKWAIWRDAPIEKIEEKIKAGVPFVLRFKSDGSVERKIKFTDLVKGDIEITENDKDHVLLKSDGIPTYHFAHAVDDYLMGTTHVVRGEEWLPSLPFHVQLFKALGFKLPKFLHISQLMKLDENGSKKKLSKRDAGVDMRYYKEKGYCPEAVVEYVMTLLNSNFEEWRIANPDKDYTEFPFSIKKMSASGCLFDFDKLNDVTKNVVAKMSADEVYDKVLAWAKEYDADFAAKLEADSELAKSVLAIGRGGKKPRKDITVWSEVKDYMGFFYDDYYKITDEFPVNIPADERAQILGDYANGYNADDDNNEWFEKVKAISEKYGYTSDMKAYKADPDSFKGNVTDVSNLIRIALTGRANSPDLCTICKLMGEDRVKARVLAVK
ncbi:MAG: glutamate--tRNA ligase [Clostridia bacterium]|nr:glutamate--tRNA ligase [Clostridia bacterium]